MSERTSLLATVGEIARRLGEPTHRIQYIVRTRRIRAISRAGNLRVFSEGDVARIARELERMATERAHHENWEIEPGG